MPIRSLFCSQIGGRVAKSPWHQSGGKHAAVLHKTDRAPYAAKSGGKRTAVLHKTHRTPYAAKSGGKRAAVLHKTDPRALRRQKRR